LNEKIRQEQLTQHWHQPVLHQREHSLREVFNGSAFVLYRRGARDDAPVVLGTQDPNRSTSPFYFMTDDEISSGQNQISPITGKPYQSVIQPNHIETVITAIDAPGGEQIWKYSRYFDNPQFWSSPFQYDQIEVDGKTITKKKPLRPEFEMYNLSADQLEEDNLADKSNRSRADKSIASALGKLLKEQREAKRLYPKSLPVYIYDTIQSD
jgi:hypothetical protein